MNTALIQAYPMHPTGADEFRAFVADQDAVNALEHPMEQISLDNAAAEFADKKRAVLHGQLVACHSALVGLLRGSCWCGMAIGNPSCTTHSPQCEIAQQVWKSVSETLREE